MSEPTATDFASSDAHILNGILQGDVNKGAAVHTFDPNTSPQAKGALAGQARDELKSIRGTRNTEGGKEISLDTGRGPPVAPTITISDVEKARADQHGEGQTATPQTATNNGDLMLGAIPDTLTGTIPNWYRVGWRAVGGFDTSPKDQEEIDQEALTAFIKEQYYGEWYHNAAVILFSVVASHFLTLFNMGWGSLVVLLAFCATYYSTSMARLRHRARDDIRRELVKTRLISETESADWMNQFLERFWLIYEPILSATIVSSVDQILSANTPHFLDSIRLTTFTLGTKAPRIDSVRTFPDTEEDIVIMDWEISFTPNDMTDLTQRKAEKKVNPKIVLTIRVGKGLATAGIPILLEDITFTGAMRIRLKLMTNFPHVQTVDISFIKKPLIDYVLKPVGGEHFGFDIANVPGLSSFIRDMTHATLGPMMYDPNQFTLNLEELLSGTPLDSAIGVLQVTVHHARGLKASKIGGGAPDPYVTLSINQRTALAQTKYKDSTFNPTWHETKFLLIHSLTDVLSMNVMDYNDHRKDSDLGTATFELSELQKDAILEGLVAPVKKDNKERGERGEIRFDVSFYPVLSPKTVDGKEEPIPETSTGIVRLTIHQAKDLDTTRSLSGDLNPVARVILGSSQQPIHSTPTYKHTKSPVWESSTEFLCTDRASSIITINVIDDRDFRSDPIVGFLRVKLEDLLEAKKEAGRDWWPLSGSKTGRLRLSVEWKPLGMAGSLQGADRYMPPIGIIRLWMQKATDVKNVEAALGGKSDPYVRVLLHNIIMARTEVIDNNLNPEWDQIVYVPVHSPKEVVLLECMDYQHLTKDRSLGSVELQVNDLVKASTENKDHPYVSTGKREHVEELRLDKNDTRKGQLHFVAEFVPAILLKNVRFDVPPNEIQKAIKEDQADSDTIGQPNAVTNSKSVVEMPEVTVTQDDAIEEEFVPDDTKDLKSTDTPRVAGIPEVTVTQDDAIEEFSPGHTKGLKSTDTTRTVDTTLTTETSQTSATSDAVKEPKYEGVELSKEELLKHQSGIIVFNLIGGQLAKRSRLEVMLDDGYWPVVATIKSRSTHARFDMVGEGFVKELDFGQVWLRLNENEDSEKDSIVAEYRVEVKDFLEQTLDGPAKFTLRNQDDKHESTVEIAAKFIPVNISLEPRETINNQGVLRVDLIDGRDLIAADRGGKSDPFAVFTLNDQKVFRSQVKKKTLTPDWNESFEVSVSSRVGSRFGIEVFDWNQIGHSESLGSSKIDLENMEPFEETKRDILLATPENGTKGEVHLILLFRPGIIVKSRKATSTFSSTGRTMTSAGRTMTSAGRTMTQVGSLPLGAGKGIVHGVGNAGKTMMGVFMRDRDVSGSKTSLEISPTGEPGETIDSIPTTQLSQPADGTSLASAGLPVSGTIPISPSNGRPGVLDETGMLKITVLGAKDLVGASVGDSVKPYVVVKVGDKEQKTKHTAKTVTPEWDETFRFIVGPDTRSFSATIIDRKTIGKDRPLGEAIVDVWSHILPNGPAADVWVELREGQGLLRLRLEFEKVRQGSLLSASGGPPSSQSRFTSLRRSTTRDRS